MRTLKKVLALTVVLATLLSISAFAAFSDEESIDESFVDAVNLLGALNVMTGDTEGTFRPNDTISRAEAAKMIYVIRNGGVDDQAAGWTGMSTFSDVASGVWFEGYVNYCASLGIIAGVGGGKFNPSGAVTGVELAKMLLVVADYKPDIEGYTGAGWNLNVIRDAQTVGMFEGYTLAYSAAATRQQAAQLFSNAILETEMAVYIGDTRVNDLSMVGSSDTIGGRFFDLEIATGVLEQVPYVTLNATGEADLDVNNDEAVVNVTSTTATTTAGALTGDSNFVFAVEPELLYQEVDVVYKESGNRDGLDDKDTVYSVYATGTSTVYETTMDAVTLDVTNADDASAEHNLTVKFDGYNGGRARTYTDDGSDARTIPVFTNYYLGKTVAASTAANEKGNFYVVNSAFLSNDSTAPVRMVDSDSDGFIDAAFVTATLYGEVANYNPDRYDFQTGLAFGDLEIDTDRDEDEFALYTFEDDLVEGDIVAVTVDVTSGEPAYTVSLVEPIIGELTRYTVGSNTIVVDGTTYDFYGLGFDGAYGTDDVEVSAESYSSNDLGEEIYLYALGTYVFAAGDGTGNGLGSNFAFVQAIRLNADSSDGMKDDVTKVQLVFADGTTDVYDYYDRDGSEYVSEQDVIDNKTTFEHTIVEYYISGSRVTFYQTPTAEASDKVGYGLSADTLEYNSTRNIFVGSSNSLRVSDSSVFFIYDAEDDEVTVYTGAELKGAPEITTKGVYNNTVATYDHMNVIWSKTSSGLRTIAYGVLDTGSSLSETGTFALTTSHPSTTGSSSSSSEVINAILSENADAEIQEITLDGGLNVRRKLYESSMNSDGTYTLSKVTLGSGKNGTVGLGSVDAVEDDAVEIDGAIYTIDEDTIIVTVDTTNWAYDTGRITEAEDGAANILFTADEDNNLVNVWVEEDGLSIASLVSYSSQSSLDLGTVTLAAGKTEDEAEALLEDVMPGNVEISFSNWTGSFSDGKTAAGETYTVDVTLTPVAGTPFAKDENDNFNVTVSGASVSNVALSDEGVLSFTLSMDVALNEITTDDVNGLALPAITIGSTPNDSTIMSGTVENATVGSVTWNAYAGSNPASAAGADDQFEALFTLTADTGYTFSDEFDAAYFETLLGSDDVVVTPNSDRTELEVSVVVTAGKAVVNNVELTVSAVEHDKDLSTVTASDAASTVTVGTLAWSGDEANADHATYGEDLTFEIPLTAASGYELAGDLTAEDIAFTADMGWEATAVTYSRDGLTATVTATVTVQEATLGTSDISSMTISLTAPADTTTNNTLPDGATIGGSVTGVTDGAVEVEWTTSNGTISDGKATASGTYTATFTIPAADGYVFDGFSANDLSGVLAGFDTVTATENADGDLVVTATKTLA